MDSKASEVRLDESGGRMECMDSSNPTAPDTAVQASSERAEAEALRTQAGEPVPVSSLFTSAPPPPSRSLSLAAVSDYRKRPPAASSLSLTIATATAAGSSFQSGPDSPLEPPLLPFSASRSSRRASRRSSTSSFRSDASSLPSTPEEHISASVNPGSAPASFALPLAASTAPSSRSALSRSAPASPYASSAALAGMNGYGRDDFNGSAQEELLDEDLRTASSGAGGQPGEGYHDPYRWERPLDAVQRHSRLLDSAVAYPSNVPASPSSSANADGRRLSRLPPGVALVDPFGFNVSNEPSPYDLAYAHSTAAQSAGITAASQQRSGARASFLGPYPAMGAPGVTASPGPSPTISPSPSTSSIAYQAQSEYGMPAQPWVKPRARSAGETGLGGRTQLRNGLLAPGSGLRQSTMGRSKLSGEIEADDVSVVSIASRQPATIPAVPSESDYLNSKVYQRTLKAQRALEKERAKAAAKGKMSRYDANALASKSTSSLVSTTSTLGGFGAFSLSNLGYQRRSIDSGRPPSVMSAAGVSGTISAKRGGRKSLRWFRSTSEGGLTLSEGIESDVVLPTSKSSSGVSLAAARSSSGQSSPRLSPGGTSPGAHGVGSLTPTLPPSPNLPSESTLRAMGVSTDQLRAAAQQQQQAQQVQVQRQKSEGRHGSRGTTPNGGQRRSPQPSPRLEQSASAFQFAPAPALPTITMPPAPTAPVASAPKEANAPLAIPQSPRPGPPARGASLEPPASSVFTAPYPTPPPTSTHTPVPSPPLSSVPPRTASRIQQPQDVPLPRSASPTRSTFPSNEPGLPSSLAARPQPSTLPAGAAPAQTPAAEAQAPPSPGKLAPASAPQGSIKRRKSGFGLLFGGGGGSAAVGSSTASRDGATGENSLTSPTASSSTARDKEQVLKRPQQQRDAASAHPPAKLVKEQQATAGPPPASKLTREKTGGSFFSRSASKLRSSNGPSSAASSNASSPAPTTKPKKVEEPFYHPSQALHASRTASEPPTSPQPPPIRPINPSPQIPQAPTLRDRPSPSLARAPAQEPAMATARTDSSSGSSTTFSSMSSNGSTLVPCTPIVKSVAAPPPQQAPQPLPAKKGGFSSLFGIGGTIRGRKSSAPVPLSRAQQGAPLSPKIAEVRPPPAAAEIRALPVLPQAPPPAAAGTAPRGGKPLRGQSLGAVQGEGHPPSQSQSGGLASQRPYATYA